MWDKAMIGELKLLHELKLFKTAVRPRGANIIQSIWAFKKRYYPDVGLTFLKPNFMSVETNKWKA